MRLLRSIRHSLFTAAFDPRPDDNVVDLMCGSGTLVLERLARCGTRRMVAYDISPVAVEALGENVGQR